MSRLIVWSLAVSIDGYGAGPNQELQNPLGAGGPKLFEWFFATRVWRRMQAAAAADDRRRGAWKYHYGPSCSRRESVE